MKNNSNMYKIAATVVLVVCFGMVALIVASVYSGDEKKEEVVEQQETVAQDNNAAREAMADVNQSKREAVYRIEMRRRAKEQDKENDRPNEPSYKKHMPASSAPAGLSAAEKKDYEQRSRYINDKRRQLEVSLRKTARRQAEGGFPVEEDYIQNELDRFDAKYGRWE